MLLVQCGGREGASPQSRCLAFSTGRDRTFAFRARSEHAVHIPAPAGMRTGDEPKAAFLQPLWERRQGPRPTPPAPGPASRPRPPARLAPARASAHWRRGSRRRAGVPTLHSPPPVPALRTSPALQRHAAGLNGSENALLPFPPGKLPPSGHYIRTPGRLLLIAF